jgi:hypothetical protein
MGAVVSGWRSRLGDEVAARLSSLLSPRTESAHLFLEAVRVVLDQPDALEVLSFCQSIAQAIFARFNDRLSASRRELDQYTWRDAETSRKADYCLKRRRFEAAFEFAEGGTTECGDVFLCLPCGPAHRA